MFKYQRYGNIVLQVNPSSGEGFFVQNAGLYDLPPNAWQFRNVNNSTMTISQDLATNASTTFQNVSDNITTTPRQFYIPTSSTQNPAGSSQFSTNNVSPGSASNITILPGNIPFSTNQVVEISAILRHVGSVNFSWIFTGVYNITRTGVAAPSINILNGSPFNVTSIDVPVGVTVSAALIILNLGGGTYQYAVSLQVTGTTDGTDNWNVLEEATATG